MFLNRIYNLLRRRRIAAMLGIEFKRTRDFILPTKISIKRKVCNLDVPSENGVKVAFIDLLLDDCYECRRLSNLQKPISTVLDIGANVGLFGIVARLNFPMARIHAYEPNPSLERHLQIQAKSAGFEYFMMAVGLTEGMVSLNINADSVLTRSNVNASGQIKQIAFSRAIERLGGFVDLVKMDCEGAEWDLFLDVESWSRVQHLSMEYHLNDSHTHDEAVSAVRKLGFLVNTHVVMDGCGLIIGSRNNNVH